VIEVCFPTMIERVVWTMWWWRMWERVGEWVAAHQRARTEKRPIEVAAYCRECGRRDYHFLRED